VIEQGGDSNSTFHRSRSADWKAMEESLEGRKQ
jgi:hypothetical protein